MHAVKQERYLRVLCTVSDGESSSSSSVCYTFPCLIAPLSLSRLLYVAGKNSAAAAAPPNGSFSLLAQSPLSVLSPFLCATTQSFSDSERRKAKQQPAAEAKSAAAVLLVSYLLLSVSLQAAPKKSAKKEEIVCKQKSQQG